MVYIKWVDSEEQTTDKQQTNKWPVGQGVKTSPSHGENTGSIPVLAAKNSENLRRDDQNFDSGHFFFGFYSESLKLKYDQDEI